MKTRPVLWVLGLVVGLVLGRLAFEMFQPVDEKQRIRDALARSIQDSREGKPGGVLDLLSQNLVVNTQEFSANRQQIANFVREQKPRVEIPNDEPQFIGDQARIVSPVTIDAGLFGSRQLDQVTLIFRKELAPKWGIIPDHRWQLVDVRVPDDAVNQLMGL